MINAQAEIQWVKSLNAEKITVRPKLRALDLEFAHAIVTYTPVRENRAAVLAAFTVVGKKKGGR